ncbi:MAG TPA: hypothetical protein PK659_08270 [Methanothrix sp.]|nr:hypothetical protein [Methanothrix sp.]HOL44229.1 hypothetical protein [Methanothrix sp.]
MPTGTLTMGDLGRLNLAYAYGMRNLELIDMTVPQESALLQFFKGPNYERDEDYLDFFTRESNPGIINAPINADIPTPSKGTYRHTRERIFWDMYWWAIDDEVREKAIPRVMDAEAQDAINFYANVVDYKIIKELVNGASSDTTFDATDGGWDDPADAEADIVEALQLIAEYSGVPHAKAKNILVIYPTKVFAALKGLTFIHNVNQSIESYFKNAYQNMVFVDFTPSLNSKGQRVIDIASGASSDALGNDALVVYSGVQTLEVGEYVPKNISRVETQSLGVFKGVLTATRRCFGCKTVGAFGKSTSPRIAKIKNVVLEGSP